MIQRTELESLHLEDNRIVNPYRGQRQTGVGSIALLGTLSYRPNENEYAHRDWNMQERILKVNWNGVMEHRYPLYH